MGMAMAGFGDVVNCRGFEGAGWAFEIDFMSPPISTQLSTTQSILLKFLL